MKRKIAVILAADIAGYSRLIAEDEEETLRRFEGYRAVFSEFVDRGGGRIFNTAGDAILAEFQSAVEAVRCAVDVQESLRARNLAYPPSRHMFFRIGITIGDVVEREGGDLLGDGVNIAARLESVAPPGGICISRSVHEAVASKMMLRFADAGPQSLKNIPERVHAYTLALEEGTPASVVMQDGKTAAPSPASQRQPLWLTAGLAIAAVALAGAYAYRYLPRGEPAALEVPAPQPAKKVAATPEPATPPSAKSDPAPETKVEAARTRQWTDCHESANADVAAGACKALLDTGGLAADDQAAIRYKLARALRDQGDPDAAIASYDKSIALHPTADAYNHRGVAYFDKGDYAKAIDDYTEALRLNPSSAEALNNRAWTRYKAGDTTAALDDANRAITLDGSKAYSWDTRGHINEARGERAAAVSDYRKALELDSSTQSSSDGLKRLGAAN